MKTTIEVPDPLFRRVKQAVARNNQTFASFVNAAMESKLRHEEAAAQSKPWMRFAGVFRDDREESARIMEVIEEDCERIDPEDWR